MELVNGLMQYTYSLERLRKFEQGASPNLQGRVGVNMGRRLPVLLLIW